MAGKRTEIPLADHPWRPYHELIARCLRDGTRPTGTDRRWTETEFISALAKKLNNAEASARRSFQNHSKRYHPPVSRIYHEAYLDILIGTNTAHENTRNELIRLYDALRNKKSPTDQEELIGLEQPGAGHSRDLQFVEVWTERMLIKVSDWSDKSLIKKRRPLNIAELYWTDG